MNDLNLPELSKNIASQLEKQKPFSPQIGIVLGSGLGDFVQSLTEQVVINTSELSGYPATSVVGHSGKIIFGKCDGVPVVAFQGRIHHYEGHDIRLTTLPIWLLRQLGVKKVILTNAAGGLNTNFKVGDLMLITDHINMLFRNPLIGKNYDEYGPRFPDMSEPYSKKMIQIAEQVGEKQKLKLQKGVYMALTGPSYETPAEISFFQKIGADAVGMSTVPEVIQAVFLGIEVLGISCITNMAAGITGQKLSHAEVTETGLMVKEKFSNLIRGIVSKL